ncbi:MAG TPA: TIGR02270 family protein [Archangium sp.]|uniref:TIGR02270 family protein n=1 Tax=Archangium sp. TaxID=1872627 RepID=UPI002E324633|nr:TIGR02270 family protein [Archangium sp.]HEX5746724.1 TIGR02270 family protein [Archangium sp.]
MPTSPHLLFWDLIERHLDEAEFLWGVWEHSLLAPDYTLDDVAKESEERLLAHVDGLVANGPEAARRLLFPALEHGEPHRVSAAALALLQSPGEAGVEVVMTALRTRPKQRGPLTRALTCAERPDLLGRLRGLLAELDLDVVAAAAEVLAFHHEPLGTTLPVLLASDSPVAARALALQALPHEPAPARYMAALQAGLVDENPRVAAAAMEAGCRLGVPAAWQRVRARAADADKMAMLLLALGGGPAEHAALKAALAHAAHRPAALWALGFVGTPEAVDTSLELINDKQSGHLAGEVFSVVTGVNLVEAHLVAPPPEEDEPLDHTAEDDLPRPDPVKVRHWWMRHREKFTPGQRYLMGEPRSLAGVYAALAHGPMRRRPALLLDLQLRSSAKPGPLLQTRAPTWRQYKALAALRALAATEIDVLRPLL